MRPTAPVRQVDQERLRRAVVANKSKAKHRLLVDVAIDANVELADVRSGRSKAKDAGRVGAYSRGRILIFAGVSGSAAGNVAGRC